MKCSVLYSSIILSFLLMTGLLIQACSEGKESEELAEKEKFSSDTGNDWEKSPCELFGTSDLSNVFGLDGAVVDMQPDEYAGGKIKVCRYEIREKDQQYSALIIRVERNENTSGDRLKQRMKELKEYGAPLAGTKETQIYASVENLGTEAAFSENIPYDKNLVIRVEERFLINIEYNKFLNGGEEIGAFQGCLSQVGKYLLEHYK